MQSITVLNWQFCHAILSFCKGGRLCLPCPFFVHLGHTLLSAMKRKIRYFATSVLTFALVLSLLLGFATPAYAAEPDMGNYLAKALSVTQTELNNYASNYGSSLPITYEKKSTS